MSEWGNQFETAYRIFGAIVVILIVVAFLAGRYL